MSNSSVSRRPNVCQQALLDTYQAVVCIRRIDHQTMSLSLSLSLCRQRLYVVLMDLHVKLSEQFTLLETSLLSSSYDKNNVQ